jgi:hypothetical protein
MAAAIRAPMTRAIHFPLASALTLAAAAAGQEPSPPQAPTPAQQYAALLAENQRASSPGRAMTDAERTVFVGQAYRRHNELAVKLAALAEQHPQDPIALDALLQAVWQVNGTWWPVELVGRDEACPRAFAQLQRDHLGSDRLGAACERISYGFCKEYEPFLRAVLAQNPHRPVQAAACLALARYLFNRAQRLELVREQPELGRQFADLFGAEYLAALQKQDRAAVDREAAALFERAASQYGDVAFESGGTAGELARAGLFEVQHLAVGVEAPDIDGEDQHGERFRLSDYRGKVVLLDFWSEY